MASGATEEERNGRHLEPERELEEADALLRETIGHLSRRYPEHAIGGAALEALRQMGPHLEGALGALAQIEERRRLTYKELSHRRAFKMLSEATR